MTTHACFFYECFFTLWAVAHESAGYMTCSQYKVKKYQPETGRTHRFFDRMSTVEVLIRFRLCAQRVGELSGS